MMSIRGWFFGLVTIVASVVLSFGFAETAPQWSGISLGVTVVTFLVLVYQMVDRNMALMTRLPAQVVSKQKGMLNFIIGLEAFCLYQAIQWESFWAGFAVIIVFAVTYIYTRWVELVIAMEKAKNK